LTVRVWTDHTDTVIRPLSTLLTALVLSAATLSCGGNVETVEDCENEGGQVRVPPTDCGPGFIRLGEVRADGELGACCAPGDRTGPDPARD